jgi:hypothetical protein
MSAITVSSLDEGNSPATFSKQSLKNRSNNLDIKALMILLAYNSHQNVRIGAAEVDNYPF